MGRFSILILLVIIVIGCKTYYKNDAGGIRPKKPKFTYNNPPYQLKTEDLIDTNSVYISINRKDDGFNFIRFFPNGRFFENSYLSYINEKPLVAYNDYNNGGFIGYYKVNNNNEIEMEHYHRSTGSSRGSVDDYIKLYGHLKNDSLFIYCGSKYDKLPKSSEKNCEIFTRKSSE